MQPFGERPERGLAKKVSPYSDLDSRRVPERVREYKRCQLTQSATILCRSFFRFTWAQSAIICARWREDRKSFTRLLALACAPMTGAVAAVASKSHPSPCQEMHAEAVSARIQNASRRSVRAYPRARAF